VASATCLSGNPGLRCGREDRCPEGTDILIMVNRGTLTMTVEGQPSQLKPGTAGHITSGAGYLLANSGRADTAFTLVHIPPGTMRARYTTATARLPDSDSLPNWAGTPP